MRKTDLGGLLAGLALMVGARHGRAFSMTVLWFFGTLLGFRGVNLVIWEDPRPLPVSAPDGYLVDSNTPLVQVAQITVQ
jgi:hypothetical protein